MFLAEDDQKGIKSQPHSPVLRKKKVVKSKDGYKYKEFKDIALYLQEMTNIT